MSEQRCGCKSTGRSVTCYMKGLNVREEKCKFSVCNILHGGSGCDGVCVMVCVCYVFFAFVCMWKKCCKPSSSKLYYTSGQKLSLHTPLQKAQRILLSRFPTAAIISCFTLSKHPLHHICVTMALITFDKRGYINFLVPALLTYSFSLECYYSRC